MALIPIHELNTPELSRYASMRETELFHCYEPEPGLFIAETSLIIERALDAGYLPESAIVENHEVDRLRDLLDRLGDIPIYTAEEDVLTQITGYHLTRGILCAMKRKPQAEGDVRKICQEATRIMVLEDVMNPTNVGAIFRSAAALGMDAVLLSPSCADPLYRRAIRVSMGNVFLIPWAILPENSRAEKEWPSNIFSLLKEAGFHTVAMALREDSYSIDSPAIQSNDKLAVFMGTEGTGLRDETIKACDFTVMIPMSHGVDSLNVAAASAIACWEFGKHV